MLTRYQSSNVVYASHRMFCLFINFEADLAWNLQQCYAFLNVFKDIQGHSHNLNGLSKNFSFPRMCKVMGSKLRWKCTCFWSDLKQIMKNLLSCKDTISEKKNEIQDDEKFRQKKWDVIDGHAYSYCLFVTIFPWTVQPLNRWSLLLWSLEIIIKENELANRFVFKQIKQFFALQDVI